MKLLVCGGRDFNDYADLWRVLDRLHDAEAIDCIVHGGAPGADMLAGKWAHRTGIEVREYRAEWGIHGKAAGPIRNQAMLDREKPDAVLACPGGSGTFDMVTRARKAGLPILHLSDMPKPSPSRDDSHNGGAE